MIYKTIVIILSLILTAVLLNSFTYLFSWDIEIESSKKVWAKVISVDSITKTRALNVGGDEYQEWSIKVNVNNATAKVRLTVGPPPKTGECIPIIANMLSNGKTVVVINDQEWRYGTRYGSCD